MAYFISLRVYGTRLHGDKRGSVDRSHNVYGTPKIAPNSQLLTSDSKQLKDTCGKNELLKKRLIMLYGQGADLFGLGED